MQDCSSLPKSLKTNYVLTAFVLVCGSLCLFDRSGEPMKRTWVSTNLGVFLCINCAGVHRSLGTHLSVILSLELDDWTDTHVMEHILHVGNKMANECWLSTNVGLRKVPVAEIRNSPPQMKEYILAKYTGHNYVYSPVRNYNPGRNSPPSPLHPHQHLHIGVVEPLEFQKGSFVSSLLVVSTFQSQAQMATKFRLPLLLSLKYLPPISPAHQSTGWTTTIQKQDV
jgi:hypothetical protein